MTKNETYQKALQKAFDDFMRDVRRIKNEHEQKIRAILRKIEKEKIEEIKKSLDT